MTELPAWAVSGLKSNSADFPASDIPSWAQHTKPDVPASDMPSWAQHTKLTAGSGASVQGTANPFLLQAQPPAPASVQPPPAPVEVKVKKKNVLRQSGQTANATDKRPDRCCGVDPCTGCALCLGIAIAVDCIAGYMLSARSLHAAAMLFGMAAILNIGELYRP